MLVLLSACARDIPVEDLYVGPGFADSDSTFVVVTWNIQQFPKSGTETINYVADIIHGLQIDVIGLQEIIDASSFDILVNKLNEMDESNEWEGYRANSAYGNYDLAFIYKINESCQYDVFEINGDTYTRNPLVLTIFQEGRSTIIINNHFKCCGDGYLDIENSSDEETRRYMASNSLKAYMDLNFSSDNVIVIGDLNDELSDPDAANVFLNFIDDEEDYKFIDMGIAHGNSSDWSYPTWPSHIDHILITNELFDEFEGEGSEVMTIKVDNYITGGWAEYDQNISDHRPVAWKFKP